MTIAMRLVTCPYCNDECASPVGCGSCLLYNAAVAALDAAALSIARDRFPGRRIGRAWINQYGGFAMVDDVCEETARASEVAVFAELPGRARHAGARAKT